MISKNTFIAAIDAIVKHRTIMDELKVPLQKLGDFPLSLDIDSLHRTALLDVLREATGDDSDWISWWLYEDGDKTVEWEEDGKTVKADLTKVGALYDFLADNVAHASAETLPLIGLKDDSFGNPRQAIELDDFSLYFEACLKHIDQTGVVLFLCKDSHPKYVVMDMQRYEDWSEGRLEDLIQECTEDSDQPFACPGCGADLEIMSVTERSGGDSGSDVLAHCHSCHLDWTWLRQPDGSAQKMRRYFFG